MKGTLVGGFWCQLVDFGIRLIVAGTFANSQTILLFLQL